MKQGEKFVEGGDMGDRVSVWPDGERDAIGVGRWMGRAGRKLLQLGEEAGRGRSCRKKDVKIGQGEKAKAVVGSGRDERGWVLKR